MTSKIKRVLLTILSVATLSMPVTLPAIAHAASISEGLEKGSCLNVSSSDCTEGSDAEGQVDNVIQTVIDIFSIVVGIIAVIMIILGGLKYIMSGGDSGNVTGAKNTILYAVIGIVVVIFAQVIVKYVIRKATGAATQ